MSHTIFGTAHLGQARCICATNPDGCPLHQSTEVIDAPDRTVCQHTGEIATLTKQRDDSRDELSNMVDLTIQVGKLGDYLKHALADRENERERADDWAEKYDAAQCRMDELAEEVRQLRGDK